MLHRGWGSQVSIKRMLHPLSYIFICILYSSLAIATSNIQNLFILLMLATLLEVRNGIKSTWRRFFGLHRFALLFLSIVVIQILFRREGEVLYRLGALIVYEKGISLSVILSLRIATIYLCAQSLSKLDFTLFKAAFAKLHLPEEISFMVSYMAQLIPHLHERFKTQMQYLCERGIDFQKCPLRDKLEIYRILAFSTIANVIQDSTKQAISLELRGFRSKGKRSSIHDLPLRSYDLLALGWITALILFFSS